jgi:uncharacterized protein YukE
VDGKQIYDNFKQGNSNGLRDAAGKVSDLSSAYMERAQGIKSLQDRMKQAWTGNAADAANAGAGPLEQAFAETAEPLDMTQLSANTQADVFDHSSGSVVVVPDKPEKPSAWSTGLKAAIPIAGPFMAANDIGNYQDGVAEYNAANETNVRVMDQYTSVTSGTQSALPTNYGVLESDGAAIAVNTPTPPGHVDRWKYERTDKNGWGEQPPPIHTTEPNDHTSTSSVDTHTGGPDQPGGTDRPGSTDRPGGTDRPVGTDRPGGTDRPIGIGEDNTRPTGTTTLPTGTKPGRTTGSDRPGKTPPGTGGVDFYPTGTGGGGGGQNYSNTFGEPGGTGAGTGPGGRGPTSGSAGGRLLDSSGRPIGGTGSGGTGSGSGAAGERGLGSGRGSGMGSLGNAAAAEAAAGRSAGGRSGQGGPMGAGGRRGEGEEDDEHQRPDFLIEADPDAIFGTDQRTSPPVIGE